ncbi:MAG: aldehyde dehydrogenase family protein [Pirellulaceae bacterium]|nr:aldehyde dehydrogenase family protein [Pirellulaceae bacterium]
MPDTIDGMPDTIKGIMEHASKSPNALVQAPAPAEGRVSTLDKLRSVQIEWQRRPLTERLRIIGSVPGVIAQHSEELTRSVVRSAATFGEIMASEVLPLAEACRYTARRGASILKPRKLSRRDNPWWMGSIEVCETRQPWGVVLIIGPSNYPLLLPGAQLVQALAAGNAVMVKPAPNCQATMQVLRQLCVQAGVPPELMEVLDTAPEAATQAMDAGVDKVIFTGAYATGQIIARHLTRTMKPAAMELSGNDAVLVLDDADLLLVARAVAYALSLNGGQSCISPRRLLATADTLRRLTPLLAEQWAMTPARIIPEKALAVAQTAVDEALQAGSQVAGGNRQHFADATQVRPLVLSGVRPDMPLATEDLFAPVLSLIEVEHMTQAIAIANGSPYALGASVFGSLPRALELADQVAAGCVTINDVLVPTADPRVSFGGQRASGYGVTRGLEGLRELTQLKVTCQRRGRWMPHLTAKDQQLELMMQAVLLLRHGRSLSERWAGIKCFMKAARK